MSINYKIKKMVIRFRQRMNRKRETLALRNMSYEQMQIFNNVKELASKNSSSIRFDPKSDEILIVLHQKLVTLKGETVYIHNTRGFIPIIIPTEAYELLVEIIHKIAHRERRKLKHEVKQRIREFLSNINEEEKKVYTEFDMEEEV